MNKIDFIVLALSLIISTGAVLAYTVFYTEKWSEQYIKQEKKEKEKKEKKLLKDHVNIIESLIIFHYKKRLEDKNTIRGYHERHLKNVINVVAETIQALAKDKNRKKKILNYIEQIRYDGGNAGKGVWISDTTEPYPKMIMHPINPSLNGKIMSDSKYRDIFKDFVSVIKNNGEGLVEDMPKQANMEHSKKKRLFYVKKFKFSRNKWNWIIGTSIFVDDVAYIMNDLKNELKNAIRKMRYNDGKGYFWIIDISDDKSPKYVMHPLDSTRENQDLTGSLRQYQRRVESFIETCAEKKENGKKKNEGYIEYKGNKPTSHGLFIQGARKLTYVRCYEPLDWIIGTGFYKEDMERDIRKNEKYFHKKIEKLVWDVLIFAAASIIILVMFNYTINYLRGGNKRY
jgi:methyl-accepting chemotaxis protein